MEIFVHFKADTIDECCRTERNLGTGVLQGSKGKEMVGINENIQHWTGSR